MYAKLFTSIYQGTLRGDSHGLLVFTNLLAHCDKAGVVDMHPRAIAEEIGLSVEQVRAALDRLEAPDDESRSPEYDGKRIIRLDEHRSWGWTVVNYAKYRCIRDEEDRREQNRIAQEKWRRLHKQSKPPSADVSQRKPESAHTEAEAEAELLEPTVLVEIRAESRPPRCPIEKIVQAYHTKLPMLPSVAVLNAARKSAISARWREVVTADKMDVEKGLEWFDWFFRHVASSRFLTGRATGRHEGWKANLDWLMKPANFAKTIEGNYHRDAA